MSLLYNIFEPIWNNWRSSWRVVDIHLNLHKKYAVYPEMSTICSKNVRKQCLHACDFFHVCFSGEKSNLRVKVFRDWVYWRPFLSERATLNTAHKRFIDLLTHWFIYIHPNIDALLTSYAFNILLFILADLPYLVYQVILKINFHYDIIKVCV